MEPFHIQSDCCEIELGCCPETLDVLYLVDATDSDGQNKTLYEDYQIQYIEDLTRALQVDINETRVSKGRKTEHSL